MQQLLKNPLFWVDLEMSGLDVRTEKILEIACILTDESLNKIIEGPQFIIKTEKQILDNMNEWCKNQHGKSGLVQACLDSQTTLKEAEEKIIEFLQSNDIKNSKSLLVAGNSCSMDRIFIEYNMPRLNEYLHYRIVDVSTIKELCFRWAPQVMMDVPNKKQNHRALDDIRESIEELKYYKQYFFHL